MRGLKDMRGKCVVFGIGNNYRLWKHDIEGKYEIVGLIDNYSNGGGYGILMNCLRWNTIILL